MSVTGPACVTAVPNGDASQAALWVIGGTSSNDTYSGLQRYSFASKTWETITTVVPVLQGRTAHSAAYLEDSLAILVYAGSQPEAPSYLSSQTFVISTQAPYLIQAFTSVAPPTNMPILQPWNSSHAVMVGGSEFNTEVFTFSPDEGWVELGTNLTQRLKQSARGTIVDGSDGSKVLEVYDMTVSPNEVSQLVLLGAGGQTAYTGETIGNTTSSRKRKRDLTLSNWPEYNAENAPTATRDDYSIAQAPNGAAVIAGGSSASPVAIFNQNSNSWVDASKFFDSKNQLPLVVTPTSKPTSKPSSSTSSPTSTSTGAGASGGLSSHDRMLRTLGIILGVLCGIAVIFIAVLLYLRWRKAKQRKREGYLEEKSHDEAHRMSFADQGATFMREAGGSVNELKAPSKDVWAGGQQNNTSHSSLAIIAGRLSGRRSSHHAPKNSYDSTARLVKGRDDTVGGAESVELVDLDEKSLERGVTPRNNAKLPAAQYGPTLTERDAARGLSDAKQHRNRSSGWSKYFATSAPTGPNGLSHIPSAYIDKANTASARPMNEPDSAHSLNSRIKSSTFAAPLDIDFGKTIDGQRLSTVASGSPALNDSRDDIALRDGSFALPEGERGLIVDPNRRRSHTESITSSYNRSTMSSAMTSEYYNESTTTTTPWSPARAGSFKEYAISRPRTSSNYSSEPRVPSRGKASFFPGAGTGSASYRSTRSPRIRTGSTANSTPEIGGIDHNAFPKPPSNIGRESGLTVLPKSTYLTYQETIREPGKPVNTDLGWLNLGLNNSQTRL